MRFVRVIEHRLMNTGKPYFQVLDSAHLWHAYSVHDWVLLSPEKDNFNEALMEIIKMRCLKNSPTEDTWFFDGTGRDKKTNGSKVIETWPHWMQRTVDLSCPWKRSTTTELLRRRCVSHETGCSNHIIDELQLKRKVWKVASTLCLFSVIIISWRKLEFFGVGFALYAIEKKIAIRWLLKHEWSHNYRFKSSWIPSRTKDSSSCESCCCLPENWGANLERTLLNSRGTTDKYLLLHRFASNSPNLIKQ